MVKVGKYALMHKKWTFRVELTKKTSHCKSRDFLRKRRLKTTIQMELTVVLKIYFKAISILSRLSRYQMLRKAEQFS